MHCDLILSTMVAHMMISGLHDEKVFLEERGIEGNMEIFFSFLLAKGVVKLLS